MNTHKAQVKRVTRGLQLGTAALLCAAGAAVGLPLSGAFGPPAPRQASTGDNNAPQQTAKAPPVMESGEAAEVLKTLISWKPAPPPEPEGPAPEAAATPPTPPPQATEWAYVGSVLMGTNRHAVVRVNSEQHLMKPGDNQGDTKLVDVDARFITVETDGQQRQIDLMARTNIFPTEPPKRGGVAGKMPMNGIGAAAMNQNGMVKPTAPVNFDQLRLQQEDMAKKRGMSPPGRQTPMEIEMARQQEAEAMKEKMAADPAASRDHYERAIKAMSDPGMSLEQRTTMLHDLGIAPGTAPETAIDRFRQAGINPEDHPPLLEALKANSRGPK